MMKDDGSRREHERITLEAPPNRRERKVDVPPNVVRIGADAYRKNATVVKIHLPPSVQIIDREAFLGCTALTEVRFGYGIGLRVVPESCFAGCSSLAMIFLPESLAILEDYAFAGCTGIKDLTIPEGVMDVGPHAFDGWTDAQTIRTKRPFTFSPECRATVIADVLVPSPADESIVHGSTRYFAVTCRCGHVGTGNYIEVARAVFAPSAQAAASEARNLGRVKHHHKQAILSVVEIDYQHYLELWEKNQSDPYLLSRNIQQQRAFGDAIRDRIRKEPEKHAAHSEATTKRLVVIDKTVVKKPKKYLKSHEV